MHRSDYGCGPARKKVCLAFAQIIDAMPPGETNMNGLAYNISYWKAKNRVRLRASFARFFLGALCLTAMAAAALAESPIRSDEDVLFLPALAYRNPAGLWVVNFRGYVFEPEPDSLKRRALLSGLRSALDVSDDSPESEMMAERARLLLVDHKRGKKIRVHLFKREFHLAESRSAGELRGSFLLPADSFSEELQAGQNPELEFFATAQDGRRFSGTIQIVEAVGVSVISDIDDTIKISNVLDKKELMRRTFIRNFEAVPGMAEVYRAHEAAGYSFHYVSGSPWQLYPPLASFLKTAGFPDGTFHLRELSMDSILNFIDADPLEYKGAMISLLLRQMPQREFVLIGDSGEKDPEVYTAIATEYKRQIRAIVIHDVRPPGEVDARIAELRARIPDTRFVVFRDAAEIATARF